MAGKIFVNYRRDDARADARSIRDRLAAAFGTDNVFMDVDDLVPGQRFDQELEKALSQCNVFLAVIGRHWLDLLHRRSRNGEPDYVRDEIAAALGRGILVIPVLVDEARLPRSDQLPEDLRPLLLHQKHDLTHERFGRDMTELIAVIRSSRQRFGWRTWVIVGLVALAGIAMASLGAQRLGIAMTWPWPATFQPHIDRTQPGQVFRDCAECPEVVVVPAGEFIMGSPDTEAGRQSAEGPQRTVKIARPFGVGKYEVTVKEYEAFVASSGGPADGGGCHVWTAYGHRFEKDRTFKTPAFAQLPSHPVVCVSWQAARTYANWLTVKTGHKYRLLSEAEWEYAARAATTTRYFFGDQESKLCEYGNGADRTSAFLWGNHLCSDGAGVQTAEVGKYRANAFGLYDMLGNVWEWVDDCTNSGYAKAPTDGSAWMSGDCSQRGIRGGSWDNDPKALRSASRGSSNLQPRDNIGFRVARDLD